jgi:hypothetical protein
LQQNISGKGNMAEFIGESIKGTNGKKNKEKKTLYSETLKKSGRN